MTQRHRHDAEIERLKAENAELRACLRWYVDNDDTYEGGRWEEVNATSLAAKRRAVAVLGEER